MSTPSQIDSGQSLDWGRTSRDYAQFRPGPPTSFYDWLLAHQVGIPGQRILDLGTGTGVLSRTFAARGCRVSAQDISETQIRMATTLAGEQGLEIDFRVCPGEALPFPDHSFDAVTANQCFMYFDKARAVPEIKRVLDGGGVFVTSYFFWLGREDPVAGQSEDLVMQLNPSWSPDAYKGEVAAIPPWAEGHFRVRERISYDEAVPFTRDSWRGRIRACRGIGAALSPEAVERFDREHAALLEKIAPESFSILHRIDAHILQPIP